MGICILYLGYQLVNDCLKLNNEDVFMDIKLKGGLECALRTIDIGECFKCDVGLFMRCAVNPGGIVRVKDMDDIVCVNLKTGLVVVNNAAGIVTPVNDIEIRNK